MDERRARIYDDLRGMLEGEVLFEPAERAPYAHDASPYEIDPLGVVTPRTEEDVITVVRYAAQQGIPLHARGAGTGISGGALGPGLVLDFSRHCRRIVEVLPEAVVVQPGVVLDVLNRQLAPLGRRLGPDVAGSESATVGGSIGLDAAGPRSLRHGSIAAQVERLRVVFANGEAADLGRESWPGYDDEPEDFKGHVVRKLGGLVRRHADLVARQAGQSPRMREGYALGRAASADGIDLTRLIVGSAGTLALVTEATLRTVPIPAAQGVLLLPFARIGDAAAAVTDCLASSPTSCDLFDRRSISLVRDAVPAFRDWIAEAAESILVVEFESEKPAAVAGAVRSLADRIARSRGIVADPVEVLRRPDCERLLGLRRALEPLLMRMKGSSRPVPLIEDATVPPEALPEFLQQLQNIFKAHDVSWVLDAHAGDGQVHPRPFLDLSNPADVAKLGPIVCAVREAALACGDVLAGPDGRGRARAQLLRQQLGDLVSIGREIKVAFDPLNVLNPGKVLSDAPLAQSLNLRRFPVAVPATSDPGGTADSGVQDAPAPCSVLLPVLRWLDQDLLAVAASCNGCGACRTEEPTWRMCPTFRALHSEAASPRSKANLIRQLAAGELDPKLWGEEEIKRNADLCVHCNLCKAECPSGVDVSSLMLEAKAAYVEGHGLPPTAWVLSRIERWSRLASRLPILSNALMRSRVVRWLVERLFGISRLRRLPKAHRTPFVRRAARLGLTHARPHAAGPRVAYFVDVYANYFDQELAEAVVAVLRQAGVNVFVPPEQHDSGMPALVAGDVEHARELALANLRALSNAVRDGYTVVCSEPTAALMLRHEYLKLTDDLDASLVAENTRDVGQYLAGLADRGQMPRPEHPLRARVGYHQPCHLRALNVGTPGLDLIRRIPELEVEFIDRGCSGMAGTFGLARDNFRTSLRAGRPLLSRLRDADIDLGATECGACRIQMEQGVTKRTLHPIKLLSLSYGLSPALLRRFRAAKPRHEIS